MDSRMATQPLLSWAQPVAARNAQTEFGAIEEVDLSTNPNESRGGFSQPHLILSSCWTVVADARERLSCSLSLSPSTGAILSTSQRSKLATVYPFERSLRPAKRTLLPLSSLRNLDDDDADSKRAYTSQFIVSDAPLALSLVDGGEWTSLLGVCALPLPRHSEHKRGSSAVVYLMNDLGDVFAQEIVSRAHDGSYDAAVQLEYVLVHVRRRRGVAYYARTVCWY